MAFKIPDIASNAKGGTELMLQRMQNSIDPNLLDEFDFYPSRVVDYDVNRKAIYILQDLPGDPATEHLANGGWQKFTRLVFSSNWQMQAYINKYDIPWSKCVVLQNAIEPIPDHEKPKDIIRLAYWSTPHRGLNILVPVFSKLSEKYDNIELDVYSSFKLYGWDDRDEPYQKLFDACREHPKINYHGAIPNEDLRKSLEDTHILAYPSIWVETSCITLMEGMSAGLQCVHPNLGALYETAANWTTMYQWNEDINVHAGHFYQALDFSISTLWDPSVQSRLASQKSYANVFYNWNIRAHQWTVFLESLLNEPNTQTNSSTGTFVYRT